MEDRRQRDIGPPKGVERRGAPRRRELAQALGNAVLEIEHERFLRQAAEEESVKLRKEVYTDKLTGAASRRAFDEKFPELVEIAHTNNEPLAFLFFDGNKIHDFNKKYGHQAGDRVLQKIAQTLKKTARPTDLVARLGGDEFGVVLTGFKPMPGVTEAELIDDTIARYGKEIRGGISELRLPGDPRVGASFAIEVLRVGESPKELYARADAACTALKRQQGLARD